MKFETMNQAKLQARIETNRTGVKHVAVRTSYWSVEAEEPIKCYTIKIAERAARFF